MNVFGPEANAPPMCVHLLKVPAHLESFSEKVLPGHGPRNPPEFVQRVPDVGRWCAASPTCPPHLEPHRPGPRQSQSLADIC